MPDSVITWVVQYSGAILLIGVFSFLLLCASVLATPWILARLPANYFSTPPSRQPRTAQRLLLAIIKTTLGLLMACAGLIMMFTPGPGLVCLILGVVLCEFPGKHRVVVNLVRQPNVFATLNWLRNKADKPPFDLPPATGC